MTLVAGAFSRTDRPLADTVCTGLRQAISRNPADRAEVFSDRRSYFAKVDIGAFSARGICSDPNGALSLLTGEPLLSHQGRLPAANRQEDLHTIHEHALKKDWRVLRQADGTFCLLHYQPKIGRLALATDKLGVRPLYFWLDDDMVVFASALRILEALPFVPKKMDLRAVTEVVALGAPLSDRTPYQEIFLLKPAQVLEITREQVTRQSYWRWDEVKVDAGSESARLALVYDRFAAAVERRNENDLATAAYLSGGLDSRCIVAALRNQGVRVHTVNFARPGTQDYLFGNDFAAQIGSIHQSIAKEKGDTVPDYSALMARALSDLNGDREPVARPRVVWSGEGGSVLLGMVHLNESLIGLLRAGETERAIERFLQREQIDLPVKLFRSQVAADVRDVARQGIRAELDQLQAEDPGRNLYLFLVHNDQRRKLAHHFENIDLHRLEFQLPFFDARFLESLMATPIDWCLRHQFYLKWLSLFPAAVTSVPWQAYPGHEPCPIPAPTDLAYQWDDSYQADEDASRRNAIVAQASELLRSDHFPHQILNRKKLRLVSWIHASGWRDYEYAIAAARTYHDYARKCD